MDTPRRVEESMRTARNPGMNLVQSVFTTLAKSPRAP